MKAVVTGGCRGLGLAFTLELLARGYEVVATYLTSEDSAKKLESEYANLKCIKCDVSDEESVSSLFYEWTCTDAEKIDLVIHNAAIAKDNYFDLKSLEEFMEVVRVNLGGTFVVDRFATKVLNRGGVIINISSNNTLGYHNPISMDYDASKAGVNMLTKDFALSLEELDLDQKIVAIAPGWINTEAVDAADPTYIHDELVRGCQKELLDPRELAKEIIDNIQNYKSGDIVEIKEVKHERFKRIG